MFHQTNPNEPSNRRVKKPRDADEPQQQPTLQRPVVRNAGLFGGWGPKL